MRIHMLSDDELEEWLSEADARSDNELKSNVFRLIGYGMLPEGVDEENPRVHAFIRRCAQIHGVTPPEWARGD